MNLLIVSIFVSLALGASAFPAQAPLAKSNTLYSAVSGLNFDKVVGFLLDNPSYLESIDVAQAVKFFGSIPELKKFVIEKTDGTQTIDWKGLLTDDYAKTLIQKLLSEQLGKHRFARQLSFNSFLDFFKPTIDRLQAQIQAQASQFISTTITSLLQQVSNSLFNGAPLDFGTIAQKFLDNLKASLLDGINIEFKYQATQIIELQFKVLYDLLAKLNQNQIAPQAFINMLITNLESLKVQLQSFVPQVSEIMIQAINQYLLTPLLKPINMG